MKTFGALALLLCLSCAQLTGAWLYVANGANRALLVKDDVGLITPTVIPAQSSQWVKVNGPGPYGNTNIEWRWKDGTYGMFSYSVGAYSSGLTDDTYMALMVAPISDATGAENYQYLKENGLYYFTEEYDGRPTQMTTSVVTTDATAPQGNEFLLFVAGLVTAAVMYAAYSGKLTTA